MPTPLAPSAAWALTPPYGSTPIRRLLLGPCVFPLVAPSTGGTLLTVGDPFLDVALPYFKHVLNYYLESAYVAAMAGQSLAATNRACLETLQCDPSPYLSARAIRLPFLAMFPTTGTAGERTMSKDSVTTNYRLYYTLPHLNFDQVKRIYPLLGAALKVLHLATEEGGLAHYNSGARVWDALLGDNRYGQESVSFRSWEISYTGLPDGDIFLPMPTLSAVVEVKQFSTYDTASAQPLWGMTATVTEGDSGVGDFDIATANTDNA